MILPAGARRLLLTVHIATSVGWVGAVAAFLALGVVGLTSTDPTTVRGVYLVMEPAAWLALVPLAFAALLTGIIQSLGTRWGLLRHYWVVFKLLITVLATAVLLTYMGMFASMAAAAGDPEIPVEALRSASPVLHAALALLSLIVATVLAVYKPRGLTPYGWRKEKEAAGVKPDPDQERPLRL